MIDMPQGECFGPMTSPPTRPHRVRRPRRILALLLLALLTACVGAPPPSAAGPAPAAPATVALPIVGTPPAAPAAGHPRLWVRESDLPRLRALATDANPLYRDGLAQAAARARAAMDSGDVPGNDCGDAVYEEYPTEMYAAFFGFLSLVENDPAARADYAARARALLMHVINEAAKGSADQQSYVCNGTTQYPPFRHPDFFTSDRDRARYHGESFALTVDWIYPTLTVADKAAIRRVFLRWSQEIVERGYHHPEPVGVVYDPILREDRLQLRFSGNNYVMAHMRNLGLMALALDPADDPGGELRGYLRTALGAHLYLFDHLTRTDSRGGLLPEGFEYSPQTAGYVAQFLLALRTAGVDAPEADLLGASPFWDDFVTAYLHSLSPATTTLPDSPETGPVYQPAFYGDAQEYKLADFINVFGPLGVYDAIVGDSARHDSARWIQTHTAPGGADLLLRRVANPDDLRHATLYFLLFDRTESPRDPRPGLSLEHWADGMSTLLSRSSWGADAAWFTYALRWNSIDHQMADGNSFGYYRKGEWLTKGRLGYPDIAEGIASSEYYNTLAIENSRPADRDESDWRIDLWRRGSQWNLVNDGDPQLLARGAGPGFVYALGDATSLYNATGEGAADVAHASRSIIWLKPDHIIIYDRADSRAAGRFSRWWLQLANPPSIEGARALALSDGGQRLWVTTLLPEGAQPQAVTAVDPGIEEKVARYEPMRVRLLVEAPGSPQRARFLHVLQGADAGAPADAATLARSDDGAYAGALVAGTLVLFPADLPGSGALSLTLPADARIVIVTGLTPGGAYTVALAGDRLSVRPAGGSVADSGGLLVIDLKRRTP